VSLSTQENVGQRVTPLEGGMSIQLVCFRLEHEEYGVAVAEVQEIILPGEITRVPHTPEYLRGLINLRSMVIPVIDLRLRFGLPRQEPTEETRIMVVNLLGKTVGLIVDAVTEVLRISRDQIVAAPPTVAGVGREYLTGLVPLGARLLILLDVGKILNEEEAERSAISSQTPESDR
jgi:purine-binding chemotaxis protein CheW